MCLRQVSFRPRCILRYFTSSGWVSCLLFSWIGGHAFFFKVKVTWTDCFIYLHTPFFKHSCILFRFVCSLCVAIAGFSRVVRTAASSAKVAVVLSAVVGKSAV
jgi:hypothetical protein